MSNMISNIAQLAIEVGVEPVSFDNFYSGGLAKRIGKALFKGSDCGITFQHGNAGVRLAGFAEGSEGDCPWHELFFPFTSVEFWDAAQLADDEGSEAWEAWEEGNSLDWDYVYPDDVMEADDKERAADMNATLKDIGGGLK